MFSSVVCYVSDMPDHDGRKIDLLALIHEITEALIHGICLVAPWPRGMIFFMMNQNMS